MTPRCPASMPDGSWPGTPAASPSPASWDLLEALVPAVRLAGLDAGFRFHDLRHIGNTLAAATGASTKELMARMGHASPRTTLIYQHATSDRDAVIAAALSDLVEGAAQAPVPVVSSLLTGGAERQGG